MPKRSPAQLDYHQSPPPRPSPFRNREFRAGFFVGLGLTAVCWLVPGLVAPHYPLALVGFLFIFKFIGGAILLYLPGMESFAWGLLTSLVVAIMLSPFLCVGVMSLYHFDIFHP